MGLDIRDEEDSAPKIGTRRPGTTRPAASKTKSTKVVPSLTDNQLRESLEQALAFLSLPVGLVDKPCMERAATIEGYVTCSVAVAQQAGTVADALVEASKKNPTLRRILNTMAATSVFGQLATALFPLVMQIAQNHMGAFQHSEPSDIVYAAA